jgi:hypothetical protein
MVRILEFRCTPPADPAREAPDRAAALPEGHSAEIIIFPGVRIERQPRHGGGGSPKRAAERAGSPAVNDQ